VPETFKGKKKVGSSAKKRFTVPTYRFSPSASLGEKEKKEKMDAAKKKKKKGGAKQCLCLSQPGRFG